MEIIKEIIQIKGFVGASLHSGIKKKKEDISIIKSTVPCVGAGVYTLNKTCAAPVTLTKKSLENDHLNAIIINSGNANACTGKEGLNDAISMIETTAKALDLKATEIAVASTGVIGVKLPMDIISKGINDCANHICPEGLKDTVKGIMTTDTFEKKASVTFQLSGKTISMTGIAKGSGMIHPNMATMLGFIMTDANISKKMLQTAITSIVDDTFNMVSVDGDTSTNDMVLVMANGQAENESIDSNDEDFFIFKKALTAICKSLSIQIAEDGEGATKLLTAVVNGASSKNDARMAAKSVISSSLVKAAFFGNDANWGRIICALGYSGANFDPLTVNLKFESINGSIDLMKDGMGLNFDEEIALNVLTPKKIKIIIDLNEGEESATAWGCDLSYEYVKINGEYRT